MGSETDFHKLYQELGLGPACDLPALTLAYRRRVQELHPDRRGDAPNESADERLRVMITLYDAAQEFHRRHGRLPGASVPATTPVPRTNAEFADSNASSGGSSRPSQHAPSRPRSRNWAAAFALALIGTLVWLFWDSADPPRTAPSGAATDEIAAVPGAAAHNEPADIATDLAIGMPPDRVLDIQGQPPLDLGDRWEYGPSYVRFEHRKLVDWYSSPLRPLKTATQRPPPVPPPTPALH